MDGAWAAAIQVRAADPFFDELSALLDELLDTMTVDHSRQCYLPTANAQRVGGGVAERGDSLSAA